MLEKKPSVQRRASDGAWRDLPDSPWMIHLPAGAFTMGETVDDKFANDTERPAHRVEIAEEISIGAFPVTVGEFRRFQPQHAPEEFEDLPVVQVSWVDAHDFCRWLSKATGRIYRLPSEAEWEYACRAGSAAPFSCGDEITPEVANYLYSEYGARIGIRARTPAGAYPANAFGVSDLHGNVCEWVGDAWHPNYLGAPVDGSPWLTDAEAGRRVIRGGAWDYMPRLLRSAWRDWMQEDQRRDNVGFRVAVCESPAR